MNLTDMKIECNYQLPILLRGVLGAEYIHLIALNTSLHFGKSISASIYSSIRLRPQYYYFEKRDKIIVELHSKGDESLAGDLFGIVANSLDPVVAEKTDKPSSSIAVYGPVNKIVGLGEVRDEVIVVKGQEDELECFFPANTVLPDTITIKKKTLEVIGFGLDTGKWLYLYSDGEGYFGIGLNEEFSPEELCQSEDYIAMEKNLQILEVFE